MTASDFKTGLVSISFRQLAAEELVALVAAAGQQGLEWGGDVHAPHGDVRKAGQVARWTGEAGLSTAAYGSYYRTAEPDGPDINAVLDSAAALGAPTVRVWAGKRGSEDADEAYRRKVVEDARRICELAAGRGLRVAFEYHGGTLTDSIPSSVSLLEALRDVENLDTLWQPPNGQPEAVCEESLRAVLPRVSNAHVFHWGPGGFKDRQPLSGGTERWTNYFRILEEHPKPRWALLEFVKDDDPERYLRDARVLDGILDGVQVDAD